MEGLSAYVTLHEVYAYVIINAALEGVRSHVTPNTLLQRVYSHVTLEKAHAYTYI